MKRQTRRQLEDGYTINKMISNQSINKPYYFKGEKRGYIQYKKTKKETKAIGKGKGLNIDGIKNKKIREICQNISNLDCVFFIYARKIREMSRFVLTFKTIGCCGTFTICFKGNYINLYHFSELTSKYHFRDYEKLKELIKEG